MSTYILPWDGISRGLVAIILATFAFALAYDGLRYAQTPDNSVAARNIIDPWYAAMVAVPCLSALCLVPPNPPWTYYAMSLSFALLFVLVRSLVRSFSEAESTGRKVFNRSTGYVAYLVIGVIAAVSLSWLFLRHRPGELLIGAFAWVAILELPRLSLAFLSWFERTRTLASHPYLKFRYQNRRTGEVSSPAVANGGNEAAEELP